MIEFNVRGVAFKSSCTKKVSWDQKLLKDAGAILMERGQNPHDYIKTELSISESKYKEMHPGTQGLFNDARTVKHGPEKIEFVTEAA